MQLLPLDTGIRLLCFLIDGVLLAAGGEDDDDVAVEVGEGAEQEEEEEGLQRPAIRDASSSSVRVCEPVLDSASTTLSSFSSFWQSPCVCSCLGPGSHTHTDAAVGGWEWHL